MTPDEFPFAITAAACLADADAHGNRLVLTAEPHLRNLKPSPEGEVAARLFLKNLEVAVAAGLERRRIFAIALGHGVRP